MSDHDIHPKKYFELRSAHKDYINSYTALYRLKTEKEEELNSIYEMIKTELIDSKKYLPKNIIRDILDIIPFNNRYAKSYLYLAKRISDDYQVKETSKIPLVSNCLFYKEYGITLDKSEHLEKYYLDDLDFQTENTIYKAIVDNDKEKFIQFIERDDFDKDEILQSLLYPNSRERYSLLELCCYHGAVDCFKLLRTKFKSDITQKCLQFSFLGGNPEIMSECFNDRSLFFQKPDEICMQYAIISHNIDFVTFLMNEHKLEIDLEYCGMHKNLELFLIYFDQTNDFKKCFVYSAMFGITSLCEYFLSHGAKINDKDDFGKTALHYAAKYNNKEAAELLISCRAKINEKDKDKKTALHYAAECNSKETAEFLISHGAKINEKDKDKLTPLHYAARYNREEIAELLISHGAKINEKSREKKIALHYAANYNNKEIAELFLSHGAKINEKDEYGKMALHYAAECSNKEIAELLISHGAKINDKDKYGSTALHYAAFLGKKEIIKLLISYGANINEKDSSGETALFLGVKFGNKEITELLISYGAKINEKNIFGKTALYHAVDLQKKEIIKLLILNGANINEKYENGETVLHIAEQKHDKEIVELLISNGREGQSCYLSLFHKNIMGKKLSYS
ncbi:ankyrin repeat protein, putative [Trichomonas vaginalis G3]|uniref:Ankyrin repeat protein, putative n=1 Tax=Trichomonas vaginalis (strain ATCC PRA-98 / G3) TaxID=412133 RepID=A2E071_TRIV3|nr:ankyrin repeat and SOCS box-containing protein 4 family [Trichomonas vaginalis G3]EAY13990.1 ankyrin repeat protein, putative [Trichomonas vaginalis G3]KAI5551815.1 ankyrin repeat and SOCS box-containing protein 4 family [Trichomonas vaginalis G3]|eukprot:XP_001326213.1 ankyrin repeat protein [Trichomonas vaginalis G3]